MLSHLAVHGLFDLTVEAHGDLEIDPHHTVEDVALTLGLAFDRALGNRTGITRMGSAYVPMDESLARVCVDLGGRPNLAYDVTLTDRVINNFECDLVEDFFKAVTDNARMTIHVDLLRGRNSHHSIEAIFKAFARALSEACAINKRASDQLPTTKGVL